MLKLLLLALVPAPWLLVAACSGDPVDPSTEAAAGYAAQQQACVARNATRAAIDACREKVRAAWTVQDASVFEGGDK